ncbi:Gfo/Idh/MocA family oxidoreductase [Streptomyces sp. NBC_01016]|uniref:Gfo/Idh/MocA family protein n=1 Tax=Streptomyces sp. NBC_01016 TaxID=2903720 RepID=UPI002250296C|nr:Gfo/Idh/MocA family oxidoreductase [Streptomyces sp. NBC_01016]MCX4832432.1 Gfo/Idh/MocA family oxidoreductase [Streptomyces sp. NBC_01016]
MTRKTVRIAMNGVTGRMGYRQHLVRSILALREQGGLDLGDGTVLWPEPVLVGRREHALKAIAEEHGLDPANISTDVDAVLADDSIDIFFDAAMTSGREGILKKAIAAGKHIYTEKPTATGLEGAIELARLAREAGVKSGVVQDKLFLPGLLKLKRLIDGGFFGRILSVRGEFGYWVFEGDWQEAQRPSWNYRSEDGGGIVVDMFPHWEYVLHELFGRVTSVNALAQTHIPTRWDENGKPYDATADDSAYGIFQIEGGIVAQINSSWDVRVNRDELVEFQVDGTEGSAVAGLRNCRVQHRSSTPKPVWNPDLPATYSFRDQWQEVPDNTEFDNGFKVQWELFLQHVYAGADYHWDLLAGARGVQMAELGLKSSAEGRRLDVPEISL